MRRIGIHLAEEKAFSIPEYITADWQRLVNILRSVFGARALVMRLDGRDRSLRASEGTGNPYR